MAISYKHRVVESELRLRLASAGAIVIEGPKACGKTATAETLAASVVLLDVFTINVFGCARWKASSSTRFCIEEC